MIQDKSKLKAMFKSLLLAIDNEDWQSLSKILHDDTHYEVSGFSKFVGREQVMDYYQNIRPIKNGQHTVDSILIEGDNGICCGRFIGRKKMANKSIFYLLMKLLLKG